MNSTRDQVALKPVRDLLHRAARAEEDHIRQNAIRAWSTLIDQSEEKAPGGGAVMVGDFVDAILWQDAAKEPLSDDPVLVTARDALTTLKGEARETARKELGKFAGNRGELKRAIRAAWLGLAVPPPSGDTLRSSITNAFARAYHRFTQVRFVGRTLRRFLILYVIGILAIDAVWSGLVPMLVDRMTRVSVAGGGMWHLALWLPAGLVVAWTATPRRLLAKVADRMLDALWCALLVVLLLIPTMLLLTVIDRPMELLISADDLTVVNASWMVLLVLSGVVVLRLWSPDITGVPIGVVLIAGAIAGCVGILPALVIFYPARALDYLGNDDDPRTVAWGSAYWTILPIMACAGVGSAWSNVARVPLIDRLWPRKDTIHRWTGVTAGGVVLLCALGMLTRGVEALPMFASVPPSLTADGAACKDSASTGSVPLINHLVFGRRYPVALCVKDKSEVWFYPSNILTNAATESGKLSLVLYNNEGREVGESQGSNLSFRPGPEFSGNICLQPTGSEICERGQPANQTAATGMLKVLRGLHLLPGITVTTGSATVAATRDQNIIEQLRNGRTGDQITTAAQGAPPKKQ